MIFQSEHIEVSKIGLKTQTRRRWDKKRAIIGHYEPVMRGYRDKHNPNDGYILITGTYKQRLGDISEEEARAEGGYTRAEFIRVWIRINGIWRADEVVTVVKYIWKREKI